MLNIEFASSLGQGLWQFVSYMGLAIFAENVILARALGVTRLMKLVPDHKAQVWDLCLPLIWVMTAVAPRWVGLPITCSSRGCARVCLRGCPSRPCAR